MNLDDTIIARSTPNGQGAIHVLRASGKDAIATVNKVFKGGDLEKKDSHTLHYGFIYTNEKPIDEVVVSLFRTPRSFTTEDVVEISCHGSPFIASQIMDLLVSMGMRPADPGEFTFRAFLHGRLDLAQAEAVADLIAADSKRSQALALDQMRGGISSDLENLRTELIDFAALLELELDFGEEDVEFADRKSLVAKAEEVRRVVEQLRQSFHLGNVFKQGVQLAIVGKPNAGKSSWINALSNDEVAIVNEQAGTTRDKVETSISINGILFRLIDTAGIRQTKDTIERIGVDRAVETLEKADMILHVFDLTQTDRHEFLQEYKWVQNKNPNATHLALGNKLDQIPSSREQVQHDFGTGDEVLFASAHDKSDMERVKNKMENLILTDGDPGDRFVTHARHVDALAKTSDALAEVISGIETGQFGDLVAFNLRYAIQHLGEITGKVDVDQDILGTIFGKFCIGK